MPPSERHQVGKAVLSYPIYTRQDGEALRMGKRLTEETGF